MLTARDMTRVKDFYVDNLQGGLKATVEVTQSNKGGVYPPGSVVQLIPAEIMVKRQKGFNPATTRGFVDVENRFGGNCFACHVKAQPGF